MRSHPSSGECTACPAADRPTDPFEDRESVNTWVRTAAAGHAFILTVNTVVRGHRVVLLRRTLVGLRKDHAVAASHHNATLNNGASSYTTSSTIGDCVVEDDIVGAGVEVAQPPGLVRRSLLYRVA
jgi:hypothetical protein